LIAFYDATDGDNWDPHYFGSSEGWDGPAGTENDWESNRNSNWSCSPG
jgi:hypothetical protein